MTTNARLVYDAFSQLIDGNNKVLRALGKSLDDIQRDLSFVQEGCDNEIKNFAQSITSPLDFETLRQVEKATSGVFSLEKSYNKPKNSSAKAAENLAALRAQFGDEAALKKESEKLAAIIRDYDNRGAEAWKKKQILTARTLHDVDAFNDQYNAPGRPRLPDDEPYFLEKGAGFAGWCRRLVDRHLRQGYAIACNFKAFALPLAQMWAEREELSARVTAFKTASDAKSAEKERLDSILENMEKTQDSILSEKQLAENVMKALVETLKSTDALEAVARAVRAEPLEKAVLLRAKMQSYNRLAQSLTANQKQLESCNATLSEPLYKLGRARSPLREPVGLPKIQMQVRALQALSAHNAREIGKAGKSIAACAPPAGARRYDAGPSPVDFYVNLMVLDMVMHPHIDHAVVHSTLGISDSVAQKANIDLSSLKPDLDLGGLGQDFNFSSNDLAELGKMDFGNIDVGNIHVDLPSISIDTSSYDSGYSSGHDGGGYDGGGGGGGD